MRSLVSKGTPVRALVLLAMLAVASGNDRMLEIIAAGGEVTVSDISTQFEISAPAVSQHLKVLREAELVKMEAELRDTLAAAKAREMNPAAPAASA